MIRERIEALREQMIEKGVQAWYLHGSDPHLSEYMPEHWQTRAFLAGFTGSAGWMAITMEKAALWTDSRYFLQAEEQLLDTGIQLMKARLPETPDVSDWLATQLQAGHSVGTDAQCIPVSLFRQMQNRLEKSNIMLCDTGDLLLPFWNQRPQLPSTEVFDHAVKYAGESRSEKISKIRLELQKNQCDLQILTALDDIAWTFNLRGSDVPFNPVFVSYALISQSESILFIQTGKVPAGLKQQLQQDGITLKEYNDIFSAVSSITEGSRIWLDPDRTNQTIRNAVPDSCTITEGISIPCQLKALKNATEVACLQQAMKKDGVALLEFWQWISNALGHEPLTEYDVVTQLNHFRKKQADFRGDSFYPIVGYREHGAVVHIQVSKENALPLAPEGILLIDSGGHYLDGTTDTTRTIALGKPSSQQKSDFTLALKGVIALTEAVFPEHTRGYHLDILARKALWEHGQNYGHGTGHGVGFFLNVHEGPMSIRMEFNDQTIKAGMVLSNEPAFYREGEYGIRTENMMVCVEKMQTQWGRFLGFETLTVFPIDPEMIETSLLSQSEIDWINRYHRMVYDELSPRIKEHLKAFLAEKTREI